MGKKRPECTIDLDVIQISTEKSTLEGDFPDKNHHPNHIGSKGQRMMWPKNALNISRPNISNMCVCAMEGAI